MSLRKPFDDNGVWQGGSEQSTDDKGVVLWPQRQINSINGSILVFHVRPHRIPMLLTMYKVTLN